MEEVIFSPAVDNRHFAGHGAFLNVDDLAFDVVTQLRRNNLYFLKR